MCSRRHFVRSEEDCKSSSDNEKGIPEEQWDDNGVSGGGGHGAELFCGIP